MKVKAGFILREIAGNSIIVPVGEASKSFNGMINVNSTGAFLFKLMQEKDISKEELVSELTKEYDVPADIADRDVEAFMKKISDSGICE